MFPHEPLVRVTRADPAGAARRDGAAEPRQLPDADRDEGRARLPGRARRAGAGVRPAPRAGHRRRRCPPAARRTSAGATATSNVLAGKLFGIPVQRHARPQLGDELRRRARGVRGVRRGDAEQLRLPRRHLRHARGRPPRRRGRASSCARTATRWSASASTRGDLAYLSIEARKILDAGGFPDAQIVASNDLDERTSPAWCWPRSSYCWRRTPKSRYSSRWVMWPSAMRTTMHAGTSTRLTGPVGRHEDVLLHEALVGGRAADLRVGHALQVRRDPRQRAERCRRGPWTSPSVLCQISASGA